MLYDTHAHLDDAKLYPDIEAALSRAAAAGVRYINTIGCDWKSSLMAVHIAEKYPQQVYAAVGVHPHEAALLTPEQEERIFELAKAEKVVGWGEIGLDYYYDHTPRDVQRRVFRRQLDAAKQAGLPVIIHNRDAHQDTLDILRAEHGGVNGGVLHCFSGSWEMAKECLRLGFHISFAGPLTYRNARSLPEVARKTPLDRILVETDCPYLSPEPFRGKTNEPARVSHTLARLAELRQMDEAEMAAATTENGLQLFRVKA